MRQEFYWCNDKSSSIKSMSAKQNQICNHSLLYHLLFTVSEIPYCTSLSVKYGWNSYIISYSIVQLLLLSPFFNNSAIPNCIRYFLMHQALFITSAIIPTAIAQFYLFLFTVSVTYQNLLLYFILSSTPIRQVFLSATHVRPFFLRSYCISNSSKLILSVHRVSYQVVLSSIYVR